MWRHHWWGSEPLTDTTWRNIYEESSEAAAATCSSPRLLLVTHPMRGPGVTGPAPGVSVSVSAHDVPVIPDVLLPPPGPLSLFSVSRPRPDRELATSVASQQPHWAHHIDSTEWLLQIITDYIGWEWKYYWIISETRKQQPCCVKVTLNNATVFVFYEKKLPAFSFQLTRPWTGKIWDYYFQIYLYSF